MPNRSRVLLLAGLATVALAGRTSAAPPSDLAGYTLFAREGLRAKVLRVERGDVGVSAGPLRGRVTAPTSTLVAQKALLARNSQCAALYANEAKGAAPACGDPTPLAPPVVADLAAACGFPGAVPACDPGREVVVAPGETRALEPGVYGSVRVKGRGSRAVRLLFADGDYVFCDLAASRRMMLAFEGPASVVVTGPLRLRKGGEIAPAPGATVHPTNIRLFVAGGEVRFARASSVAAHLCAPDGLLTATAATELTGSFVARQIKVDRITARLPLGGGTTTTTAPAASTPTTSTTTSTSTTTTTSGGPPSCGFPGGHLTVSIAFDPQAAPLAGLVTEVSYPPPFAIPGALGEPAVRERVTDLTGLAGAFFLPSDLDADQDQVDDTLRTVFASTQLLVPGAFQAVHFDCPLDTPVDPAAFPCVVLDASDPFGEAIAQPVTCAVTAVEPCTPLVGTQRLFDVRLAAPPGTPVAGVTVLVDYPEGQVNLPGSGGTAAPRVLNRPPGAFATTNDLDYAVRQVLAGASALPTLLFTLDFEDCSGATPPVPGDFACLVEDAADPEGDTLTGVTCSVAAP